MAIAFKPGDPVKQRVVVIEGVVKSAHIIDNEIHYTVDFVGEDGEPHERTFTEDQLQAKE